MTWLQRYRVRHYFADSIWILPVVGTVAAIAAVRLLHWLEQDLEWQSPVHPDTARAVMGTMASAMLTSILTGMGEDGRDGARVLKQAGGLVLAEHESTCVVYGMPRAVVENEPTNQLCLRGSTVLHFHNFDHVKVDRFPPLVLGI